MAILTHTYTDIIGRVRLEAEYIASKTDGGYDLLRTIKEDGDILRQHIYGGKVIVDDAVKRHLTDTNSTKDGIFSQDLILPSTYNESTITTLQDAISNFLVDYCLAKWMEECGVSDTSKYTGRAASYLDSIKNVLNARVRPKSNNNQEDKTYITA